MSEPISSNTPIQCDIDATVTPITQQPISSIDSTLWENLPVSELYVNMNTLQNRYYAMLDMKQYDIARQIMSSINGLKSIIEFKEKQKRGLYDRHSK